MELGQQMERAAALSPAVDGDLNSREPAVDGKTETGEEGDIGGVRLSREWRRTRTGVGCRTRRRPRRSAAPPKPKEPATVASPRLPASANRADAWLSNEADEPCELLASDCEPA